MKNGFRWTLVLVLAAGLLLCCGTALADVEVNEVNFPDPVFRQYVLDEISNGDSVLTDEEIKYQKGIAVEDTGIKSLKGIEYFFALEYLDCSDNQLTSIDLSKNTAIKELHCYMNQLTSLDVSKNKELKVLRCSDNQISSLNVSENTLLEELSCSDNQLKSLDVTNNTKLKEVHCTSNRLTSLDVSKNALLESLWCDDNKLTALDIDNNKELDDLSFWGNQLTRIDVSGNTKLRRIECDDNPLISIDLGNNTLLERVMCRWTQLTTLDVSNCPKIVQYISEDYFHDRIDWIEYGVYYEGDDWLEYGLMCDTYVQIIGGNPVEIPVNWGEPTYTWADDYSTVTAQRVDKDDNTRVQTETVNTTSKETKAATCTADGEKTYTAVFTNPAFAEQMKTVAVSALGHDWGETKYIWAKDFSMLTATHTCKRDAMHIETENAIPVVTVTKAATCEEDGEAAYTATFVYLPFAPQTKTAPIAALGHDWGDAGYVWSDDNSSVTATRVCSRDKTHTETETANVTETVTKEPKCEEDGAKTCSAVFTNPAFSEQTKPEPIAALGHDWGEPRFDWAEDYSTCTAAFRCGRCDQVDAMPAKVTSEVTVKPTQEAEGVRTYTATVAFEEKTYTDTKTAPIEKLPEGTYIELNNTGKNGAAAVTMYGADCYILPTFAIDSNLTGVTFKSAKKKIAAIDANGKLELKAAGKTTITVTAIQMVQKGKKTVKKKVSASISLTVVDPTIPTSIAIEQGTAFTVYLGKPEVQLAISAEPAATASTAVTWKSSKPKNLKVDKNTGMLTPMKAGTAKITATSTKNKKAKATITVTVVDLTVPAGIEITSETGESKVTIKGTLQLKATPVAQDNEVPPVDTVTWKTGNKKLAKVDKNGLVTGLKAGKVKITATSTKDKTVVGEFTVEVVEAIPGEAEAFELPDAEQVIEEPVVEQPAAEEPVATEEELNDWYGDDPIPEVADWYEEF